MAFSETYLNSAWIALFVLFIFWALSYIPKTLTSFAQQDDDTAKIRMTKAYRAYSVIRDGVLLLLVSLVIAFTARADSGAVEALTWVFFGIWTLAFLLSYVTDSRILLSFLQFLGLLLILASIITSISTASGSRFIRS